MLKVKDKYDYRRELCAALRSGKYKQVRGGHGDANSGCVIRVFGMINGLLEEEASLVLPKLPYGEFDRMTGLSSTEAYRRNDGIRSWSYRPHTFEQLADWIEAQP